MLSIVSFATFAAVEIVVAIWLWLDTPRRLGLIAAHVVSAVGGLLVSYSSLRDGALLPLALGAPLLVVGSLVWTKDLVKTSLAKHPEDPPSEQRRQ